MKYPPAPLTLCLATLLQNLPLCSRCHSLLSIPPPVLSTCKSIACALLNSLASLFATPFLCFQSFADSFAKTGGWGCPAPFPATRLPRALSTRRNSISGRLCFQELTQTPPAALSIGMPRIFKHLQIPFRATPFFSHPYKMPGCGILGRICGMPGVASSGRQASYGLRGKKRPQVQTANLSYRGCTLRLSGSITMAVIASRRGRRRRLLNSTSLRRWRRTWRGIFRPRTRPVWGP